MVLDQPIAGEIQTLASAFRSIGLPPRKAAYLAKHDPTSLPPHFTLGRRRYVIRTVFEEWLRAKFCS